MNYPENCLRGISVPDHILEDGSVSTVAFNFSDVIREDGWKELSVNWDDDENSKETLLNQKRENGEPQFKVGYAIVPRNELDHLINQPMVNGTLSYERLPIENNKYHGNILLKSNLPKPTIRKIQAGLALIVSRVVQRT
jgi:hypothetical protein